MKVSHPPSSRFILFVQIKFRFKCGQCWGNFLFSMHRKWQMGTEIRKCHLNVCQQLLCPQTPDSRSMIGPLHHHHHHLHWHQTINIKAPRGTWWRTLTLCLVYTAEQTSCGGFTSTIGRSFGNVPSCKVRDSGSYGSRKLFWFRFLIFSSFSQLSIKLTSFFLFLPIINPCISSEISAAAMSDEVLSPDELGDYYQF